MIRSLIQSRCLPVTLLVSYCIVCCWVLSTTTVDGFAIVQQHRPSRPVAAPSLLHLRDPFRTSGTTIQSHNQVTHSTMNTRLFLSSSSDEPSQTNNSSSSATDDTKHLPFYLDPNTKGGALVLMVVLFVVPYGIYQGMVHLFQMDEIDAGITVGIGFTVVSTLAWMSTYLFRVATKDMTYARQLKDYENAVIAKRLEELDEDEIQALLEEVEKDNF